MVLAAVFLLAPFILVGASLMTLVASFTKSYKEAQTWVSAVLFAPTLPIMIVSILQVRPKFEFMFIPSLSQHLLLVDMIKNGEIALIVNTTEGKMAIRDSQAIRGEAVARGVTYYTTLAAAQATCVAMRHLADDAVNCLQDLHARRVA